MTLQQVSSYRSEPKTVTVEDKEVKEDDGTQAAEKRELTHCIEGSGGRQEGSTTLIKEKEQ